MAQLNLRSTKIRCFFLLRGGIYLAASILGWKAFPPQPKLSKAKRREHCLESFGEAAPVVSNQSWVAQENLCGPQRCSVCAKLGSTELEN